MPQPPSRTPSRPSHVAVLLIATLILAGAASPASDEAVLERISRDLMDAIAPGEWAVWDRYTDDELVYAAEDGALLSKAELREHFQPLPQGYLGKIEPTAFVIRVHGDTAIVSFKALEHLVLHGQSIDSQYVTTHTFLRHGQSWKLAASQVLALPLEPPAIELPGATMRGYVGRYALAPEITRSVFLDGGKLVMQQGDGPQLELVPEFERVFFVRGQPRTRIVFVPGPDGLATELRARREGVDVVWRRLPGR